VTGAARSQKGSLDQSDQARAARQQHPFLPREKIEYFQLISRPFDVVFSGMDRGWLGL